jgi:transcriptional regulator of acetoin/glycerol metabolism
MERTLLLTTGDQIRPEDFILAQKTGQHTDPAGSGTSGTLDAMEKHMIITAIEESGGNLSRSSEKLGISRATLYRKMEKHGIKAGKNE